MVEALNSTSNLENLTSSVSQASGETVVNNFAAPTSLWQGNGMVDISTKTIKYIIDIIRPNLEPVTTNYS
jgi:hypothetical protein